MDHFSRNFYAFNRILFLIVECRVIKRLFQIVMDSGPYPYPDPDLESGFGSRRAIMTHNNRKN
jgi:hypothetical protein